MKKRLDLRMTELGLSETREKARALIMEGAVYVDHVKAEKAGENVSETAEIEVRGTPIPFVSRGGLKLDKAIRVFAIALDERTCADIGASTGGFTDCMLQHGASRVYSVDVGYGQLHWKLRNDARVIVMERRNARLMEREWFPTLPDFASVDTSFISLKLILPPLFSVLAERSEVVALIKPQFEAGREQVGKNGVVRDPEVHRRVISEVITSAVSIGFSVAGLDYSPITGPKGNIEFLLYLTKGHGMDSFAPDIDSVVRGAHEEHF